MARIFIPKGTRYKVIINGENRLCLIRQNSLNSTSLIRHETNRNIAKVVLGISSGTPILCAPTSFRFFVNGQALKEKGINAASNIFVLMISGNITFPNRNKARNRAVELIQEKNIKSNLSFIGDK